MVTQGQAGQRPQNHLSIIGAHAGAQAHVRQFQGLCQRIAARGEAAHQHVAAADGLVLFYAEQFQSEIATQAVWAGLPCIYSDHPGFRLYRGAGLVAKDEEELGRRMREMRDPATYARLRRQVTLLRRLLDPARNAPRYLAGL